VLNVIEKSGFGYAKFPRLAAYLDACRARPSWEQIPRLPGL
jgi:glutathione S-transferase